MLALLSAPLQRAPELQLNSWRTAYRRNGRTTGVGEVADGTGISLGQTRHRSRSRCRYRPSRLRDDFSPWSWRTRTPRSCSASRGSGGLRSRAEMKILLTVASIASSLVQYPPRRRHAVVRLRETLYRQSKRLTSCSSAAPSTCCLPRPIRPILVRPGLASRSRRSCTGPFRVRSCFATETAETALLPLVRVATSGYAKRAVASSRPAVQPDRRTCGAKA